MNKITPILHNALQGKTRPFNEHVLTNWAENNLQIVCSMATIESRKYMMQKTMRSIHDRVNVLACMKHVKDLHSNFQVTVKPGEMLPDQLHLTTNDHAAMMKFSGAYQCGLTRTLLPFILLTIDDDLIYPPNYVEDIICGLSMYPNDLVSYHGRHITPDTQNYLDTICQPCLDTVSADVPVQLVGTGCMAMVIDKTLEAILLPTTQQCEEFKYMADLYAATFAAKNNLQCRVLAHPAGWITAQPAIDGGIWAKKVANPAPVNEKMRELINVLKF